MPLGKSFKVVAVFREKVPMLASSAGAGSSPVDDHEQSPPKKPKVENCCKDRMNDDSTSDEQWLYSAHSNIKLGIVNVTM